MTSEQFLDNELKGTHQIYDESGVTLLTGIEHSEICRIMDEYSEYKLKLSLKKIPSNDGINDNASDYVRLIKKPKIMTRIRLRKAYWSGAKFVLNRINN